jgi:hypothetical protein
MATKKGTVKSFIEGRNWHVDAQGPFKTIACWTDLLGFGSMLDNIDWHLENDGLNALQARLANFSQIFLASNNAHENIVMINDGMLRTFDQSIYKNLHRKHEFIRWLHDCLLTHCNVTGQEKDHRLPGLRTILCEGEVLSYQYKLRSRAASINQLNTALSKCYIADSLGSRIGLKKGGIYIERTVIDTLIHTYGSHLYGGTYLSLWGPALLKDFSIYESFQDLLYIDGDKKLTQFVDRERTSWIKLGDKITINREKLQFDLVEVTHYSPIDESGFYFFDTFRGDAHGLLTAGARPTANEYYGDNKFRAATKSEIKLLKSYVTKINESKNKVIS